MPIPKQRFYFLRHGQTDWNKQGRFQGLAISRSMRVGVQQAQDAAQTPTGRRVDLIVASPPVRHLPSDAEQWHETGERSPRVIGR